ncbi:putative mpv17 pmp22 family protein [Phaeomoniella chlamydospora]|uniref:Putative mpv17 pmp22 family protein n=1 Tax=Phaeomoniella chlamydospora TaxID=158046 RepID=A0A0G2DZN1_PHACM|nr:putative mpv17 pmp22 family protein [Phaeomoniella chlamydospora]
MPSPLVSATLQAASLSTVSNLIAQAIEAHKNNRGVIESFNAPELMRFVALTLITAPPNYKWQQFLERTFPAFQPSGVRQEKDVERAVEKREDDHEKHPKPKLNIRNTVSHSRRILNNESLTGIKETVPVIVNGYKIWPIASIISFSFIPVERRIVFLSFIGLCWGVYMSLVAARV